MRHVSSQINVDYGAERVVALDRIASTRGLSRPELLRRVADELIAADAEGRTPFASDQNPIGTAELNAAVMEIDRIARVWAGHEADIRQQERKDRTAMSKARAEFIEGIPERIMTALNPIRAEMLALAERIDNQPRLTAIEETQRALLEAQQEHTAALERSASTPRTQTVIRIGGEQAGLGYVIVKNLLISALGAMLLLSGAKTIPAIGVPLGAGLAGGGSGVFCTIADHRHDLRSCVLRDDGETVSMTARRAGAGAGAGARAR